MHEQSEHPYAKGDGYEAVEIRQSVLDGDRRSTNEDARVPRSHHGAEDQVAK